jgi:SAM-dependent MidA family methyltransferase
MLSDLPEPDAVALAHSERLQVYIKERIAAGGGRISFADYMEQALYAPGLGYYSAGARKLGPDGDFVTAPEISPLFSRCLAAQCAEVLESLGGGSVIEAGAGSGVMAATMLEKFAELGCLPDEYLVIETSADLRDRQSQLLHERVPELAGRVRWLDGAPDEAVRGVIVANEVADALPVERFRITPDGIEQAGVIEAAAGLAIDYGPAAEPLEQAVAELEAAGISLPAGYESELSLRLPAWIAELANWLAAGSVLLLDYGFSRREYYLPERVSGTLRCFYRHRAHDDPLLWPGLQDITAWVDFSYLAEAAAEAGFEVGGYTTQAQFLLAAGLDEELNAAAAAEPRAQAELAQGLRQLLLPGEMGEAVKVMALTKESGKVPGAMHGRDMRSSL